MLEPEKMVDGIKAAFGDHPGHRTLHAKGAFYVGTFTATPAAASQEITETRSRRPPTARAIAATSSSALPSSASLTEPEVSITTHTRGGLRRRLGSTTPGTADQRRDGRR